MVQVPPPPPVHPRLVVHPHPFPRDPPKLSNIPLSWVRIKPRMAVMSPRMEVIRTSRKRSKKLRVGSRWLLALPTPSMDDLQVCLLHYHGILGGLQISLPFTGTNQLGRTYSPGLPLSMTDREKIVGLYQNGWKICDISKKLCVTHSCVSKILNRFRTTGSVRPKDAKESRVESPLVTAIRDYRFRLGMTRQSEIREQLILDGICQRDNVPSRSSINQ